MGGAIPRQVVQGYERKSRQLSHWERARKQRFFMASVSVPVFRFQPCFPVLTPFNDGFVQICTPSPRPQQLSVHGVFNHSHRNKDAVP